MGDGFNSNTVSPDLLLRPCILYITPRRYNLFSPQNNMMSLKNYLLIKFHLKTGETPNQGWLCLHLQAQTYVLYLYLYIGLFS